MNQLQDLGYETNVALKNLGSIGTMLTIYLTKLAFIAVLTLLTFVWKNQKLAWFNSKLSE
jgi:hypothetical protein